MTTAYMFNTVGGNSIPDQSRGRKNLRKY